MSEVLNKNFVDFTGGLNFTDPELNMKDSYFVEARNVELVYDSTIKKRNGFKLIKNLYEDLLEGEDINEIFYFQLHIIVMTTSGRVLAVDDLGVVEVIWDQEIANSQALEGGSLSLWANPAERCFGSPAGGLFILSNGYDKPLQVNLFPENEEGHKCSYLLDPATGSNANIPIIYQCKMVNHYCCACLIGTNKIFISAKDQPGLWADETQTATSTKEGALVLNIDQIVGSPNQNVVGLSTYKNMLCVMTDYHIVVIDLDVYTEATVWNVNLSQNVTERNHTPTVNMVVDNAGCATVGSVQNTMKTLVFLSINGINTVERNAVSQNFVPNSLSEKVLPYIKSKLNEQVFQDGVWSFVDRQKYMYGVKFSDDEVLCLSFHPNIGNPCYWIWDNIKYKSFTNNVHGRMIAADKNGLFIYTDDSDGYCQDDYVDEDTGAVVSEKFLMKVETPWISFGKPNNVKTMDYLNVVTDGTARFTVKATCDMMTDWQLSIDMLGGSKKGYGSGANPFYGGGLISGSEELCEYPQVFIYAKFGFESSDELPLRIIRYGAFYKTGGIRR